MKPVIPPVGRYMTLCPYTIEREEPLIHAHLLMRAHDIRHLPVLHGGKIAGVISERDLYVIEAVRKVDPEQLRVGEVMATDLYSAPPDAPLDEVVHEMAQHKYGCVVIVDHGKVVGVFTTTDAAETLSRILVTHAMEEASRPSAAGAARP